MLFDHWQNIIKTEPVTVKWRWGRIHGVRWVGVGRGRGLSPSECVHTQIMHNL